MKFVFIDYQKLLNLELMTSTEISSQQVMVQKFSGSNKQTKNTIALRENMKECFIKFYVKNI